MHARFVDQAFVTARQGCAATRLAQLNVAYGTAADQLLAQLDHPIDHRVFRAAFVQPCTGQQQHGAAGKSCVALQFRDEFFRVQVRLRTHAGIEHPVHD
ncbi:hypothetical protein D3C79_938960 [compost metagenome]